MTRCEARRRSQVAPFAELDAMNRRTMMTGLLACALPGRAVAGVQTFPLRPIRVIVPFAAGGPMDTVVRAVAQALMKKFHQPVVVESRTGAGSIIGVNAA